MTEGMQIPTRRRRPKIEVLLPHGGAILAFREPSKVSTPTRMRKLLTRVLEDENLGRAWVATVYGEPAGYLLAVYVFSLEHQGITAEIDEFFVLPPHRGLGLGHQMLAVAEAQFRVEGCTNVSLQLGRSNEAARKFYRSNGFDDRAGFELVSKKL